MEDRDPGRGLVVGFERQTVEIAAVVRPHDALAGAGREQQGERLQDRRLAVHPVEPAGGRDHHAQATRRRRVLAQLHQRRELGVDEPETDRLVHASLPTTDWPGSPTVYLTVPGGVPSVSPVTVSRQAARPSTRTNAE
jgi:hypothetical protein